LSGCLCGENQFLLPDTPIPPHRDLGCCLDVDHCSLVIERSAEAFGIKIAGAGSTPNQILYSGEYLDPGTGNYDLRARIYRQNSGTFLTADTTPGQLPYVYTAINPVMFVDPTGNFGMADVALMAANCKVVHVDQHTRQEFAWVNGLEYIDDRKRHHSFNVFQCTEHYGKDLKQRHFVWLRGRQEITFPI